MPEFLPEQIPSASERVVSVAGISNSCKMDLVPAPKGEDSLKDPVVEVESVDVEEQYNMEADAPDLALDAISSDFETDSDDSDGWDNLSSGEDAIQILRDDEIRDGLGMQLYPPSHLTPDIPALGDQNKHRLTYLVFCCSPRCLYSRGGYYIPTASTCDW